MPLPKLILSSAIVGALAGLTVAVILALLGYSDAVPIAAGTSAGIVASTIAAENWGRKDRQDDRPPAQS
ncbi:MAG: hypothetical protein AAFZ65_04265 [Planctomycetota bacterium]